MYVYQNTPLVFPDGRVMVLNQYNQFVEVTPVQVQPQQRTWVREASQPPVSQASSISEEIAEEVLAQPIQSQLTELPTKSRASCPVDEEEDQVSMTPPDMTFLSSQDQTDLSCCEPAESESGTSEQVDLSEDFTPLNKQVVDTTSETIQVLMYVVQRKVQMRSGPTATSAKVCVLYPGQRVQMVKTKTSRMKTGFITTKAYVLCDQGQGWVSVNRQDKKTDETFVFKGQLSAASKRLVQMENVWRQHQATVQKICNQSKSTFSVHVSCPTWQKLEELRIYLGENRLRRNTLVNKRMPRLVNLKRVFGNSRPVVHVYEIDVNAVEFLEDFNWENEFQGSTRDFQHQVADNLRVLGFAGLRRVKWATRTTQSASEKLSLSMRDFCTVEFSKDSHLRNFLKNFEKYEFFQGAKAKVDHFYANKATIPAQLVEQ